MLPFVGAAAGKTEARIGGETRQQALEVIRGEGHIGVELDDNVHLEVERGEPRRERTRHGATAGHARRGRNPEAADPVVPLLELPDQLERPVGGTVVDDQPHIGLHGLRDN